MNIKIEKILAAESQITNLQTKESRMRRDFMSDGTIDADEQSRLDAINEKIRQAEELVQRLREEVETNRRIWEGRARDYSQVRSRLDDLRSFGHPDAGLVEQEVAAIDPLVAEQCWADATAALDQAETSMEPVYANYLEQLAARDTYEPLREDCDARLDAARNAAPTSDDVTAQIEQADNNLGAVDAHVEGRDYLQALPLCEEISVLLDGIEAELERLLRLKEQYESEWAALQDRLQQVAVCQYPDLVPMQEDILALSDGIQERAAEQDYETALEQIAVLSTNIDSFLTAFEESASEQDLYESRLPGVEQDLALCQTSEFPALAAQQTEINGTADRMHAAAGNSDFETALLEMDALVGLIDTYLADLDNARLGREFEEMLAAMEPQLDAIMICTYPVLQDQIRAIEAARAAAEMAAGAGDYAQGIAKLNEAAQLLGEVETAIAMQDAAKLEYDARSPDLLARCDAIASCEYPQLAEDHQALLDARAAMDERVGQGDYIAALQLLDEIALTLQYIEEQRDTLRVAQTEYETRLPAIISRFDSLMQSDFAELVPVREGLMSDRTAMETAAEAYDFPLALDYLNRIERGLNALDARMGDLEALRQQYEALLATIEAQLADVAACTHEELTTKRDPILTLRDEMIAAAEATDFAVAVQKATALIPMLAEFAILEELLAEYHRRLELVEPRLTEMRGYTYLSLEDDKAAIEDLNTAMRTEAMNAQLREALAKMETLETKLTEIKALNHELMLQEAVYNKLVSDMADQIAIVRANTIEQAQTAADAVIRAYEELERLGEAHEYIEAIPKADEVNDLIDAYLAKVDEFGDAEEAYNIVRDMALVAYGQAQEQASQFDDLSDKMSELETIKTAMENAASDSNFAEAKAKAHELLDGAEALENEHRNLLVRKETLLSDARTAIARFDALDGDARERAEDAYDDAKEAKETLEDAMGEDDLEALADALSDFDTEMTQLEDALKSEDQLRAEYEGKRDALKRQVDAANGSPYAGSLTDQLDAVNEAYSDMEDTANDDNDFRRALRMAGAVETALTAFDREEGVLSGQMVRFEERMNGLATVYGRAIAITTPEALADRADALRELHEEAHDQANAGDYDEALKTADQVRNEAQAMLDEQERLEDAEDEETRRELEEERAKEDECGDGGGEEEDDDKSIGDQIGDAVDEVLEEGEKFARDPTGTVSDWIEDDRGPLGEVAENIAQEVLDHIPNPPIAEVVDEVLDIKDKVGEVLDAFDDD